MVKLPAPTALSKPTMRVRSSTRMSRQVMRLSVVANCAGKPRNLHHLFPCSYDSHTCCEKNSTGESHSIQVIYDIVNYSRLHYYAHIAHYLG